MKSLGADATAAAFPLGGIGTGNVSIGARGQFVDWEIFNAPGRGNVLPYTFFAIRAKRGDEAAVTRVLESRLRPPHERTGGYVTADLAGLPRLADSRLTGEYPFVRVEFADPELPVSLTLEAFTPLVPLDAANSGLPAAVLRYRVRNSTERPVHVTVAGSIANPVGFAGMGGVALPRLQFEGTPHNEFRDDGMLRGLLFSSSLPADDLRHGTVVLVTADEDVTAKSRWLADSGFGAADFWKDLDEDGLLQDSGRHEGPAPPRVHAQDVQAEARVGSLGIDAVLEAGQERSFAFILAWHFPNRPKGWPGWPREDVEIDRVIRNFYATQFENAWDVARHLHEGLPLLERRTREFHASVHGSTLPPEIIDAAASNLATLRSTTCFRLEDGRFLGWEGSNDQSGCCAGNCTHVWNYAQSVAFLFPELERSMRKVEFGLETDPEGHMNFRSNRVFELAPVVFMPAVDGQLGAVVRLYREWKFSGDEQFLAELWPSAARTLEYAFEHWDSDGDSVLDAEQHNTYDIEFHGPEPLASTMFYAALRAGAAMAGHLGDQALAERYRRASDRGAEAMDQMLWNGQYYVQRLEDPDAFPYQYGVGCLSDQLFGQLLAHVVGLGHLLPEEHVKQAIASVFRYNFRPRLHGHVHFGRTYALDDEAGLLACSWPLGGRPRHPFKYGGEVWTGIEYQVAAHLIYEGLIDEGRSIVAAVRARHDGHRRNPWNEVECGSRYVRSMASWALLLAYSGFGYDAVANSLSFAPAVESDEFRCFFSTGAGWGDLQQDSTGAQVRLTFGALPLASLTLRPPPDRVAAEGTVNGESVRARHAPAGQGTTVLLDPPVSLAAGDVLAVRYVRSAVT